MYIKVFNFVNAINYKDENNASYKESKLIAICHRIKQLIIAIPSRFWHDRNGNTNDAKCIPTSCGYK